MHSNREQLLLCIGTLFSILFLSIGISVVVIDIEEYGWGLYLILLSLVLIVLLMAFCIVGPDRSINAKMVHRELGKSLRRLTAVSAHSAINSDNDKRVNIGLDNTQTMIIANVNATLVKENASPAVCDSNEFDETTDVQL
jgi:hypothetical protein